MEVKNYDFRGYATKSNIKCTDGLTIAKDAFKDDSGRKVPLLYQHLHDDPENILGHAILENREDGVYAYGFFNGSEKARAIKEAVAHGDIDSLSIYANSLSKNGSTVVHGVIRELSVVLAGANPGAVIENISFAHSDGTWAGVSDDEAIIKMGIPFDKDEDPEAVEHADNTDDTKNLTVGDVFNTLTDDQKTAVCQMLLDVAGETIKHSDEGGEEMKENVFDAASKTTAEAANTELKHDAFRAIVQEAIDNKSSSLKDTFLSHAATEDMPHGQPGVDYGIANIDYLFPDYRNVRSEPDMIKKEDAWVTTVMNGTSKTPFSRIKTMTVDVTADIARARGYRKGHLKKEEVIKLAKRVTGPTTIYKKQRLDRDDIIDITDMDVVSFLKREMQMKLREECARAVLLGDGRPVLIDGKDNPDKIEEDCIRPIYSENELYAYHVDVDLAAGDNDAYISVIQQIGEAMLDYKGSGSPILFTSKLHHYRMLRVKDTMGRKLYASEADLLADLNGVSRIVEIPFEITNPDTKKPLFGIIVDLRDYTIGTNRGGQTSFFDDFDLDFNQYVYLYETRFSGALTRIDSAVILEVQTDRDPLSITVDTEGNADGDKQISDLQENVAISDTGNVSGILKYVTGYTAFPETPDGHFLNLKLTADSDDDIYVKIIGGKDKAPKKVTDGQVTAHITDEMAQRIQVTTVSKTTKKRYNKILNLSGLTLEPKTEE